MKATTVHRIYELLRAVGVREIVLMDESYVLPSREWLIEFADYIRAKAPAYVPQSFDFEQFARWAAHEADLALVKAGVINAGHTFGEATTLNGRELHALNLCICSDEKVYALEPQTGAVNPVAPGGLWPRVRM